MAFRGSSSACSRISEVKSALSAMTSGSVMRMESSS